MSKYFLLQYQPVVDKLLEKHQLHIDHEHIYHEQIDYEQIDYEQIDYEQIDLEVRELIAKTIRDCKLPRHSDGSTSSLTALRSAIKHATAVQKQKTTPGTRTARMLARCTSLAQALDDGYIAFSFGVKNTDRFSENLRQGNVGAVDVPAILSLLRELEQSWLAATQGKDASSDIAIDSLRGRRRGITARTVAAGLFVWKLAGHRGDEYVYHDGPVTGLLPNFLRDLLKLCGLHMSDEALHHSIVKQQAATNARVRLRLRRVAGRARVQK